ncbi:hypothetical protein NL452_27405, partial [Klebsiella pneumoniae]|nr:hypothetical protein [Klebsiella pneumoniae]
EVLEKKRDFVIFIRKKTRTLAGLSTVNIQSPSLYLPYPFFLKNPTLYSRHFNLVAYDTLFLLHQYGRKFHIQ